MLHLFVSLKWYGHPPPQDCETVFLRVRVAEPPPHGRVQELQEVQLLTLQCRTGQRLLRRLLHASEDVKTTAMIPSARIRAVQRAISENSKRFLWSCLLQSKLFYLRHLYQPPSVTDFYSTKLFKLDTWVYLVILRYQMSSRYRTTKVDWVSLCSNAHWRTNFCCCCYQVSRLFSFFQTSRATKSLFWVKASVKLQNSSRKAQSVDWWAARASLTRPQGSPGLPP